jgi:hypothetical protein
MVEGQDLALVEAELLVLMVHKLEGDSALVDGEGAGEVAGLAVHPRRILHHLEQETQLT